MIAKKKVSGRTPVLCLVICSALFALLHIIINASQYNFGSVLFISAAVVCADVLLAVYMFVWHGNQSTAPIVSAVVGLTIAASVIFFFNCIFGSFFGVLPLLLGILCAAPAVFGSLKGFTNKKMFLISWCIGMVTNIFASVSIRGVAGSAIEYVIKSGDIETLYSVISYEISYVSSYIFGLAMLACSMVAICLFAMMNETPWIIRPEISHMRGKEALGMLRNRLYFDEIAEEEYQTKRAYVIQRLL